MFFENKFMLIYFCSFGPQINNIIRYHLCHLFNEGVIEKISHLQRYNVVVARYCFNVWYTYDLVSQLFY